MLRVLTLNVGSLLEAGWEDRRHEVVAWLDLVEPDVVCFQEVWQFAGADGTNTAGWVADHAAGHWHWAFGGFPIGWQVDVATRGDDEDAEVLFGSAVLSRWPIDDDEVHRLPLAEGLENPVLEAIGWELLHVRTAGLEVFSTHLAPAPTDGLHRVRQVAAIDGLIRAARGDADTPSFGRPRVAMPTILCGDFNAEPDSDEIRFLCGLTAIDGRTTFHQDAWRVAASDPTADRPESDAAGRGQSPGGAAGRGQSPGDAAGHTQDWRTHPLAAGLNVHRKRIDYVFVGDSFRRVGGAGRVLDCHVVADRPLTGVQASDHCGVLAEIAWPDRPD